MRSALARRRRAGRVLLRLLEGLAQVALTLTGHLAHDLGAIDEEEEGN